MRAAETAPACSHTAPWTSSRPTNTSSFLRVQQGGEVEAVPELVAAQGRGARGFRLSEKRQARGPGESVLGNNALPVSVGAQGVRRGVCTGQGGRTREDTTSLRPAGPKALSGLYLTQLCFNTNSPERKSCPFGGGGLGKNGLCYWGDDPQPLSGPRLPTWQGKMAPKRPSKQV